jgi:predicted Zn-dependent peptidase
MMLAVNGGARTDERRPGLATFTADMLDEGANGRDALGIAGQAEYLGATLRTSADWEVIRVQLNAPKRTLDSAVALMSDVALRPTFASADVARQRALRVAAILQARDQPNAMAQLAFNALVYPQGHPYHRSLTGDSASTVAIDSAAVREFWAERFVPANAKLIITGDLTLAEARAIANRAFGEWSGPSRILLPPDAPALAPRTLAMIYLVDKPGAAQSVITVGGAGVARRSPDYFALEVMNTILGGSFSSRLNQVLREEKGYTYGAGSGFTWRPLPGPFLAQSPVRTNVTDSSLALIFRELHAIGDSLVTPDELARAKSYIALGLADAFETTGQVLGRVDDLQTFGLPLDYYDSYAAGIMAVTADDVQRVAKQYVTPDRISVVVVGDVQKIRAGIEALDIGPVSLKTITGDDPVTP